MTSLPISGIYSPDQWLRQHGWPRVSKKPYMIFSDIKILKAEQDQIMQCFFQKHLSNHATQALRRTRSLLGLNLKIINDAGFSGDKE